MALPTVEELTEALREYVDAGADQTEFIANCVREAVAYITQLVPNEEGDIDVTDGYITPAGPASPLGDVLYRREVIELGSELFYRQKAKNGVVSVDSLGNPIRISNDPYRAAAGRLSTLIPWGFA